MRIHELLEACLEYIAVEGVIGCEPRTLLFHLHTLDPSIDDAYFSYVYTLLLTHPTILPVLTAYPIPSVHNPVPPLLGTVPLPDDYVPPAFTRDDIDYTQYYSQGLRGTKLSYELSGQTFRKGKDIVKEKRKEKIKKQQMDENARRRAKRAAAKGAKAKKDEYEDEDEDEDEDSAAGPSGSRAKIGGAKQEEALMRTIGEDDGDAPGRSVRTADLKSMADKWGSRLRLRCTDDEIYYRLTGSYQKNPKITPILFHVLQLSARSREKGITAVELGPAVGTSQGSIHYYMKVICSLGLCAKIPAVLYASITSTLIFHRFLDANPNYRALMNKGPKEILPSLPVLAEGQGDEDAVLDKEPDPANAWGLDFGQISESELMAGFVVKERVLKLLDHPMLKNHLLKNKNILPLIGWHSTSSLRHRRAMLRHVEALCVEGSVEKLEMGTSHVKILRLAKYNPDYIPLVQSTLSDVVMDLPKPLTARPEVSLSDYSLPYHYQGAYLTTLSMEYQIHRAIFQSGVAGLTIYDLHIMMNNMFRRMLDHSLTRTESTFVPAESRDLAIASLMENFGRERRLRAFTIANYRTFMLKQGAKIDDDRYPRDPPQIGRFADLGWRKLYATKADYDRWLDVRKVGEAEKKGPVLGTTIGRVRKGPEELSVKIRKYVPKKDAPQPYHDAAAAGDVTPNTGGDGVSEFDDDMGRSPKRMKYGNEGQIRGRPRKYIYVVDEDGKVRRNVIEQVFPHPDLVPIYIWMGDRGVLVPAPENYTGLGPVEKMSEEVVKKEGKKPAFFNKYPFQPRGKGGGTRKREKKGESEDEGEAAVKKTKGKGKAVGKKGKAVVKGAAKKRKKGEGEEEGVKDIDNEEEVGAEESIAPIRKSKRAKPTPKNAAAMEEVDELDDSEEENKKVDDGNVGVQPIVIDEEIDEYVPPGQVQRIGEQVGTFQQEEPIGGPSQFPSTVYTEQAILTDAPAEIISGRPALTSAIASDQQALKVAKQVAKPRVKKAAEAGQQQPITTFPQSLDLASTDQAVALPPPAGIQQHTTERRQRQSKSISHNGSVPPTSPLPVTPHFTQEDLAVPTAANVQPQAPPLLPKKAARVSKPRRKAPTLPTPPTSTTQLSPSRGTPLLADTHAIRSPIFTIPETAPSESNFFLPSGFTNMKAKIAAKERRKGSTAGSSGPASPVKGGSAHSNPGKQAEGDLEPVFAGIPEETSSNALGITLQKDTTTAQPAAPPSAAAKHGSSPASARPQPFLFPTEVAPIRSAKEMKSARSDLGSIRRTNEVVQALKDIGGVCSDFKLWQAHAEWTKRVAGTDAPFAPVIASMMDRLVYKRILATVINQGRVKETIATFALPTGKWDKQHICYITDTPQESVQAYIRELAESIGVATGKSKPRKKIEMQPFSEVRSPSLAMARAAGAVSGGVGGREALLREDNVISYLYGYKSGKCARLAALHRALITASRDPYAKAMISTSPRVFSIKLLHENLSAGEWFSLIHSTEYDPVLEEYLQNEENRKTQIRHLPANIKAYTTAHAYQVKMMTLNLLKLLTALKVIGPLLPVNTPGDDIVECRNTHLGPRILFKPVEAVAGTQYFRLYEFAPIYHMAAAKPSLLGILPVMNEDQVDKYWMDMMIASLQPDVTRLPTIGEAVTVRKGQTATLTETVDPGSNGYKALRSRVRWRSDPHLVSAQATGVNALVDVKTGVRTITDEAAIEKAAYDLAIPKAYMNDFITERENQIQGRRTFRRPIGGSVAPAKEQAAKLRAKIVLAEESLAKKIADRQLERKAEWEGRVRAAAERMKIEYSPGLVEFCRRQALHSATGRGDLSDNALEEGCRLYLRSLTLESGGEQLRPAAGFRPTWPKKTRKDKKIRPVKDMSIKHTRNRRNWTHEDDELLLDGEAVIRGRWKNRPPTQNKGRPAMIQLFPDVNTQTLFNRLKKILALPGRKLYHDKLINAWYEVYVKYVGTDALQDDKPDSLTELDLRKHVEFFRQKVDKFTLKMDATTGIESKRLNQPDLPEGVEAFLEEQGIWEYRQNVPMGWQAFFDSSAEETRHQILAQTPLIVDLQVDHGVASATRSSGVLRGALKILQGTPADLYNVDIASRILAPWSKVDSNIEIRKLEAEKAIHPNRIDRTVTGRPFAFTVAYNAAGEPSISAETQREAEAFPTKFMDSAADGMDWTLLEKGGDLASLLNMVSNDEVDFEFDIKEFPTIKHCPNTYNTRALNDDGFEFDLRVRPTHQAMTVDRALPRPRSPFSMAPLASWGVQSDDSNELRKAISSIVKATVDAGDEGISKPELLDATGLTEDLLTPALAALASEMEARVFWAGYDTARLEAIEHWAKWTISTRPRVLNELGGLKIIPEKPTIARRWIDIWGAIIQSEWEKSWRSALAFVVTRTALSESGLFAKLSVTMDRLGIVEVLQVLLDIGYLERKWVKEDDKRVLPPLEATDATDSHDVAWFVNSKGLWV